MRILLAGQAPISLTSNGVVVSMLTFARGLAKAGHQVTIVTPDSDAPLPPLPKGVMTVGLPGVRYPMAPDFPYVPKLAWRGYEDLLGEQDIVHVNHPFSLCWTAAELAHEMGKPVVGTYHTLYVEYAKDVVTWPILKQLAGLEELERSRRYANVLNGLVVPTRAIANLLKIYGISHPEPEVIPTGIMLDNYMRKRDVALLRKFKLPTNRPLLLFVGRMSPQKNVTSLIEVMAQVKGHPSQPHLVLVGDGEHVDSYRALAKARGLASCAHFLGRQPKEITNQLFGQATAFLFLSLTDTQGIVVLEAMAAGTPVIAADRLGPTEFVESGKTGYLLPADDPAKLISAAVAKTSLLLEDKKLHDKLAKAAIIRAANYSVDVTIKHVIRFYDKMIKHHIPYEKLKK